MPGEKGRDLFAILMEQKAQRIIDEVEGMMNARASNGAPPMEVFTMPAYFAAALLALSITWLNEHDPDVGSRSAAELMDRWISAQQANFAKIAALSVAMQRAADGKAN